MLNAIFYSIIDENALLFFGLSAILSLSLSLSLYGRSRSVSQSYVPHCKATTNTLTTTHSDQPDTPLSSPLRSLSFLGKNVKSEFSGGDLGWLLAFQVDYGLWNLGFSFPFHLLVSLYLYSSLDLSQSVAVVVNRRLWPTADAHC